MGAEGGLVDPEPVPAANSWTLGAEEEGLAVTALAGKRAGDAGVCDAAALAMSE